MLKIICTVCKKDIDPKDFMEIYHTLIDHHEDICSPSCLVEYAWGLKDNQEKLSKSKNV